MKLLLTIESGTLAGRVYDLENGFLTIGRGDTCTIHFDPFTERIASKQHAFVEAKFDGYYLTDNKSTNGTYVNGQSVTTVKLKPGDLVEFGRGGVKASVNIQGEPEVETREAYKALQVREFNAAASEEPVSIQASLSSLGLGRAGSAAVKPDRTRVFLGVGVLAFVIPVLLTLVALTLIGDVGLAPAILATVIAFTPAMFYLLPLIWLDRYDPEPAWLLALAFSWGALVAIIVSYYVNTFFGQAVYSGTGSAELANFASSVFSAPIIEEGSKGVGLLVLLIFFRRYFDDILDGIVFGGVIALGFATVENVLYYGNGINDAYAEYGATSAALWSFLVLFAIRGIFSPFAHAAFTSMTGIGCGIARESHNTFVRLIMPVVGYIGAVLLHMIWNGMGYVTFYLLSELDMLDQCEMIGLGGADTGACIFLVGYLIVQVPFFLIFSLFIMFIMRRQRRIMNEMLALDVARGLIPEEHLKIATSVVKGQTWLLGGLFKGKYRARSRYIRAIGKLGLSYWHIQRATVAQGHTASFQQNPLLRDEVLKWREAV